MDENSLFKQIVVSSCWNTFRSNNYHSNIVLIQQSAYVWILLPSLWKEFFLNNTMLSLPPPPYSYSNLLEVLLVSAFPL